MTIHGNWSAILAGGDGQRLRSFTRVLTGDDRPKQFCRLFGQRTLLAETRDRVFQNVEPARTLYVVNRSHRAFYSPELDDVLPWQIIEQPANRGTTAAVTYLLARLRAIAGDGVVGLFPADHYYKDTAVVRHTVTAAYALAQALPHSVVLVGAEPNRPETEYGWIEPGQVIDARRFAGAHQVRTVTRFCEKPQEDVARDLMGRGCLWNTLVVVGRLSAFERMMAEAVPDAWGAFARLRGANTPEDEARIAQTVYGTLDSSDFSRDVLARDPERLVVVNMPEAGWTDLGQARRVLAVLSERGEDRFSEHAAVS